MNKNPNTPKFNRCDACGRNAHKVALRRPVRERNAAWTPRNGEPYYRLTGRTEVVGYCPSCLADTLPDGWTVVYDRRSDRSKAQKPLVVPEVKVESVLRDGRFVWASCGHPAERDINGDCYTCGQRPS